MKKVLIILSCLILTGCNVKYNVLIDDGLKVSENIMVEGDEELYDTYYKTSRNKVLKNFLDMYNSDLEQNGYSYELVKGEYPHIKINKDYNNIGDYLDNSKMFNGYFDKINYNKDGNIIKIETQGFNPNISDDPGRFYVSDLDIAIKCFYKVTNHNASEVDEKTNTYHFILKSDTEDFKILLEFDSSRKFNPYLKTILTIFVSLLIIVLVWIIVYFLNRKKKI